MGSSFYAEKFISYTSEDDTIGLDTEVEYTDQNGNSCKLDMRELVRLMRKSREKDGDLFGQLISDLESGQLAIGFPIIVAMDKLGREFPKEIQRVIHG